MMSKTANSIGASLVFPGVPLLTGLALPVCRGNNMASGSNDLYTVPVGKRAMICSMNTFKPGAGTTNFYPEIKISGVYYRLRAAVPNVTNARVNVTGVRYIAEAGETLSVRTDSSGLNAWVKVIEFSIDVPLYSPKLLSLSTGDNTIYTVPTGKSVNIINGLFENTGLAVLLGQLHSSLLYANESGASRTLKWSVIPSGQSNGVGFNIATSFVVANTSSSAAFFSAGSLNTGDSVILNIDAGTATQLAWLNVIEV